MPAGVVRRSDDPAEALAAAESFLASRPIDHNIGLSLLHDRISRPEPGRYWWTTDGAEVNGFVLQSPTWFSAWLTPAPRGAIRMLVETIAEEAPDLPGAIGEAATAALFAGHWAERRKLPAAPVEGSRIYRLSALRSPDRNCPGRLRLAGPADRNLLVEWANDFGRDNPGPSDPGDAVDPYLDAGRLWVWDDERPVSMARATEPLHGVVRVGYVYTPPELRSRGYASSCVAAVSAEVLGQGASECMLYTELSNPSSNAIYRSIGYEAVSEVVSYRFG